MLVLAKAVVFMQADLTLQPQQRRRLGLFRSTPSAITEYTHGTVESIGYRLQKAVCFLYIKLDPSASDLYMFCLSDFLVHSVYRDMAALRPFGGSQMDTNTSLASPTADIATVSSLTVSSLQGALKRCISSLLPHIALIPGAIRSVRRRMSHSRADVRPGAH
jgi:hypothetical protein